MAIGIVDYSVLTDKKFNVNRDVEYSEAWYGYYHGGSSLNVCGNAKRVHSRVMINNMDRNWLRKDIGVCVDFDKHKLSPIHNGENKTKFTIDIPSNTSYFFSVWFDREG